VGTTTGAEVVAAAEGEALALGSAAAAACVVPPPSPTSTTQVAVPAAITSQQATARATRRPLRGPGPVSPAEGAANPTGGAGTGG
jgi:hypothetical protein